MKHAVRRALVCGCAGLALLAAPRPAVAGEAPGLPDLLGPFFDLGLSVTSRGLRVDAPGGEWGLLRELSVAPAIRLGSPFATFRMRDETLWGFNLVGGVTAFSAHRQVSPEAGVWDSLVGSEDVGTGVKGLAAYLVPTVNYFGRQDLAAKRWTWRVGVGAGLGYLRATGDILLDNPPEGVPGPVANPELRRVDMNRLTIAASLFAELRAGLYSVCLLMAGPFDPGGGYETGYSDLSLSVAYSWYRRADKR